MKTFSQKYGYKPVKSIVQFESMDDDLRNGLWNALYIEYWERMHSAYIQEDTSGIKWLMRRMWLDFFKKPIDTLPPGWSVARNQIRTYFFKCPWNEVYDFVQFVANNYPHDAVNESFVEYCNNILQREVSGYRFVGDVITPITAEEEIAEIEEALRGTKSLKLVAIHLKSALDLFSDRQSPDYRNSIKESISAVETICNLIAKKEKATLGEALKTITATNKVELHSALQKSFSSLYGYTSDADGIRHSLLDEPNLDFEDSKFMLVSCAAFINYLKVKASKAGIDLEK